MICICCGYKSECNLFPVGNFRQAALPLLCGLTYKLVISMVASMPFSGKWLVSWIFLKESVASHKKFAL